MAPQRIRSSMSRFPDLFHDGILSHWLSVNGLQNLQLAEPSLKYPDLV